MKNIKRTVMLPILSVGAIALTSCGPKGKTGDVTFWSSFGATYTNALDVVVKSVEESTNLSVTHVSQGSYDSIKDKLSSAINVWKQVPDIAMGYPDHFAEYLGNDALVSLDNYVTDELKADYIADYLEEDYFWNQGKKHLYGVPFNKSTEVLGYNGTFFSWCKSIDNELQELPETWEDWAVKGPKYQKHFDELLNFAPTGSKGVPGKVLFGKQANDGSTSGFKVRFRSDASLNEDGDYQLPTGEIALLDYTEFTEEAKKNTRLISWDATDNAFITLIKQWGAKYTELPESEYAKHPYDQQGNVVFGSKENLPKVVECLKFFNGLAKQRIFGIPAELNSQYSSDAFAQGKVMFMVCSSGGLSYNTKTWHSRFTVAPIPYHTGGPKLVISQGANICMLDTGNEEASFKVMKALTTGDAQVEWCLNSGYYPCSYSASNDPRYLSFMEEGEPAKITEYVNQYNASHSDKITYDKREKEVYSKPSRVAYREGSKVNKDYYMDPTTGWKKFVDVGYYGSSGVRMAVKNVLKIVFKEVAADAANAAYEDVILKRILTDTNITTNENNKIVLD